MPISNISKNLKSSIIDKLIGLLNYKNMILPFIIFLENPILKLISCQDDQVLKGEQMITTM